MNSSLFDAPQKGWSGIKNKSHTQTSLSIWTYFVRTMTRIAFVAKPLKVNVHYKSVLYVRKPRKHLGTHLRRILDCIAIYCGVD